jgi:choline dehydrogenase-like flavoprotein
MSDPFWTQAKADFERRCQVVVVGSGAGGAVTAVTLAEAGFDVVLLESGFRYSGNEFPENVSGGVTQLYAEGGFRTTVGKPPIPVAGGETLGGSTVINSAICFRTPEKVLADWNESCGGLLPASEFYPAQDEVEACLKVGRCPDGLLSGYDRIHKECAKNLGWSEHNIRRNTPTCAGCGRCNTGCNVSGKMSVDRAFLPRAAAAGAEILTGCRVESVHPGRVEGYVRAKDRSVVGTFVVHAERVVLSAGAIGSPRLLLDSGLKGTSGRVGHGLRLHPVFSVMGYWEDRRCVAPGATQGHYVDEFEDDWIVLESNPTLIGAVFNFLPVHGREGMRLMSKAANFASTGAMLRDFGEGQVKSSRGPGARIKYILSEDDQARARKGSRIAAQLWLEGGGADFVILPVFGAPICRTMEDVDRVLTDDLPGNRLMGYSSHPQASCRVGSALDETGQVLGVDGVHVIDAASHPSNVGRNPQISVMTTARVLAARLASDLGKDAKPLWAGPGPLPPPTPQHEPCGIKTTASRFPVLDEAPGSGGAPSHEPGARSARREAP